MNNDIKKFLKNISETPGVYLMRGRGNKLLYVGKAVNLKRRVSSYFLRPHDARIQKLVSEIKKIDYELTDTALEALILEAELIKKYEPPFNIKDKDGKSFLYIGITKESFSRVILFRGKDRKELSLKEEYGPFTSASSVREALKIIRRIFPFSDHDPNQEFKRPCFNYQIGLCPGTCVKAISKSDYEKNIRNIKLFFAGKKKKILKDLEREMRAVSRQNNFEKAGKIKKQIFALNHINDIALITDNSQLTADEENEKYRIEGYDISNISGDSAVGVMVVFENDLPNKNEYRKFKIKTVEGPDDFLMMQEVLTRRFNHPEWRNPNLILIDGGLGQVNAAREAMKKAGRDIPILGIAKGAERKRNDIIGKIPKETNLKTLIAVRDEAHRFAIGYHRELRSRMFLRKW